MKNLSILLAIVISILFLSCNKSFKSKETINPILGDISFETKFGYKPNAKTNDFLRIKTHLEYVESLLRQKDVSYLPITLQENRRNILNLLRTYWQNGKFPKNYDYKNGRKPCFIDKNGTICAVGYLIEQTKGRETAEQINSKHKYDELLAMNDNQVDNWIKTSGLTKNECAMIQPSYNSYIYTSYSYNHITPLYGSSSSIISGLNLSLNTINGIQITKGSTNKTIPVIGLITGAGQVFLGASNIPKEDVDVNGKNFTNESQKTLSFLNIGLGTSTMILSAWNLLNNRKPKDKRTTWNIYSFPTQKNDLGLAFSLTRKF